MESVCGCQTAPLPHPRVFPHHFIAAVLGMPGAVVLPLWLYGCTPQMQRADEKQTQSDLLPRGCKLLLCLNNVSFDGQ